MFHRLFRRKRIEADLAEEMREHLRARTEELVAKGMPPEAAHEMARREFGNPTLLEEEGREVWRWPHVEALFHDVRFAAWRLRQSPNFTVVCILTLALGLGANLALFTLIRAVLLKPLPFRDPARLVMLYEADPDGSKTSFNEVAAGSFADWQRTSRGFAEMAFYGYGSRNLSGRGGQLPEKLETRACTWTFFQTLGVKPAYGQFFSAADDKPGAPATVVLSWGLFERRYAADPAVLGQTILLDGQPYTMIGVLPSWFAYPDHRGQLWTPAYHDSPPALMESRGEHDWHVVARLKPGVSAAAAVAEVAAIQSRIHRRYPDQPAAASAASQPLLESLVGDLKTPLYVLFAAVACLLLITLLNVASLLLARAVTRRKEIAVRAALGGGHWRIGAEQLTESLLLACAGEAAATAIAYGLLTWMVKVRPDLPRMEALRVDAPVLFFGIGLILLTGLLAGLLPLLTQRAEPLARILQDSSRSVRGGKRHGKLSKYLVGIEVALTAILLIGAGLLLKSFAELRSVRLGCATKNALTMSLTLPDNRYKNPGAKRHLLDALLDKVRALPGVEAAGLVSTLPGAGYGGDTMVRVVEHPPLPQGQFEFAIQRGIDPGYFHSLAIPLLNGREFSEQDDQQKARRIIINAVFARKLFPHEDRSANICS